MKNIEPPYVNYNVKNVFRRMGDEEIWLPINTINHPEIKQGIYFINNYGQVFSNGHVSFHTVASKYLKPEISNTGYYRVNLIRTNNKPKHYAVHRLEMETFYPVENMKNLIVNHIDGNKLNNELSNLEWVDMKGNVAYAIYNGFVNWQTGDQCSWSTINSEIADKVAELLATRMYSQKEISLMTGCQRTIVTNIANGISWRDSYVKYRLWEVRNPKTQYFTDEQLNIILNYIKCNIHKYDSTYYRALCMDICKVLGIAINRTVYIELMDIIYKYLG